MKLIPLSLMVILCSAITGFLLHTNINQLSTTSLLSNTQIERWKHDLDFMRRELEQRHIDLYHCITADFFLSELNRIKQQLPSLTESELIIELMRLMKQVEDGHTQFAYWMGKHHRYPLELRLFDTDLRVMGIDQRHKELLGATLIAVENRDIDQIQHLLEPVLQGVENIHSAKQRFSDAIVVAEILHGLKISQGIHHTRFTFKLLSGEVRSVNLNSLPTQQFNRLALERIPKPTPPRFSQHRISIDGLTLYLSNDNRVAYLDFYRYPDFYTMQEFAVDLKTLLSRKEARKVIIDLRNNGGGDFFVGLQLAWALILVDNLDWLNGVYVLIGPKTFSAAMSNAVQYRQLLNAQLIGEPTGANPVGYQDADTFELPNSGWTLMYSKRLYRFQETPTSGVQPDKFVAPDWKLLIQGKDNQLEWILKDIQHHRLF